MITVVGVNGAIPPSVWERASGCALVLAGRGHLSSLGPSVTGEGFELSGDLAPALDRIEAAGGARSGALVLASGDPGFFGIVRVLAERFGRESLEVLPAPSCVAVAFARAGLAWDDALVVSAHGRDPQRDTRRAVNVCRALPKVAVLTSPAFGPAELARELSGLGRRFVVGERLGEAEERVFEGDGGEVMDRTWHPRSVAVVLDPDRTIAPMGWASPRRQAPEGWALPEEAFDHAGGMITKAEVRALALARLGPGVGDLIWDVGAGSGSVAVECARFGAACIAVEKDPASCLRIARNAAAQGCRVQVARGEAPEALASLPQPDAAFVGGTGGRLREVVEAVAGRVLRCAVVALAGVEKVPSAMAWLGSAGLRAEAVLVQAARLEPLGSGTRLAPLNPVFLVWGRKP